jgi:hypothetical protein
MYWFNSEVAMSDKSFEPTRGTAITLYNRFAELMLVVGLDENSGLVSMKKDTDVSILFIQFLQFQIQKGN